MFDNISPDSLLEEMLESIEDDIDKREGSIVYNALAPAAGKLFEMYTSLGQVLNLAFPQTSEAEYLEYITMGEGVERILATPSTRHFQAEGESGQVVEGDRFFVDNIYFAAQETIDLPGIFRAISEETGSNAAVYDPDTILPVEDIDGLELVSLIINHENDVDGIDDESDPSLLQRYWEKVENSPGPGNTSDYIRWAKEIAGVGNVLPEPLWNGDGTVRIVILTPDGKQASQSLINEVQQLIDPGSKGIGEGKAPVGARVTVATAGITYVSATIPNLVIELGYTLDQVKSNVEEALHDYLSKINPGGVIRIQEAGSVVIGAVGVLDTGDLRLDGKRDNIILDITELASLGEVTYS